MKRWGNSEEQTNRILIRRVSDRALLTQRFARSLLARPALLDGRVGGTNAKIGAHREGVTPVPMPNTAVKPFIGDNTWVIKPWENSTVPNYR